MRTAQKASYAGPAIPDLRFHRGFSPGTMAQMIIPILDDESSYSFLTTSSNPLAPTLTRAHVTLYLDVLGQMARQEFSGYAAYPLVDAQGPVLLDMGGQTTGWPVAHVLRDCSRDKFASLLERLNGPDAQKRLAAMESAGNSILPRVLAEKGITPLVLQDGEWNMSGRELRTALAFLSPSVLAYCSN